MPSKFWEKVAFKLELYSLSIANKIKAIPKFIVYKICIPCTLSKEIMEYLLHQNEEENRHSEEESKETWQVNVAWWPRWDPGSEQGKY